MKYFLVIAILIFSAPVHSSNTGKTAGESTAIVANSGNIGEIAGKKAGKIAGKNTAKKNIGETAGKSTAIKCANPKTEIKK